MTELGGIRDILEQIAASNPLTREAYLEWCAERDRFEAWKRERDAERARSAKKKPPARAGMERIDRKRPVRGRRRIGEP
jgi:hypothetical protein